MGRVITTLDPRRIVTPGLVPGVHLLNAMDGRVAPGHDR
jgi:hypothetical protein